MSVTYQSISWGRQKKIYDLTLAGLLALVMGCFIGVSLVLHPRLTAETLIIRATSLSALLLLHVILCIGPLARLDTRFLPLLYNRRHLGVTMFLLALVHGVFAIIQFHALGNENPIVSALTAYQKDFNPYAHQSVNISNFPFEPFGLAALVILFLMAATSHDFWLKNLGPGFWKLMHMLVYLAYGLVLAHVVLGALQSERSVLYPVLLGAGFLVVAGLHLVAYTKEAKLDSQREQATSEGFTDACYIDEVAEGRGKVVTVEGERVALFRHKGRIFATSNVCRHQGGPIGEGRVIDGCITCPWHGWQYQPEDGCSPPPFQEVIPTRAVKVIAGRAYVKTTPNALKTVCEGSTVA